MTYVKQMWDDDDPAYPISAARMLHIEDGIEILDTSTQSALNLKAPVVANYMPVPTGADQTAAIQAVINAVPSGGTLIVGDRYRIDGQLNITQPIVLKGSGRGEFYSGAGTAAQKMLNITSSDVHLRSFSVTGPQYATNASQTLVNFIGTSGSSPLIRVSAKGLTLTNSGKNGLLAQYVKDFTFDDNTVENCCYTGIGILSGINGSIDKNRVRNITMAGYVNAYGIYTSRNEVDSLVTDPRCEKISMSGNIVRDIPGWDGINTHGGKTHTIVGNIITNVNKPIELVGCQNTAGDYVYAPLDMTVVGNVIDSTLTAGAYGPGIILKGTEGPGVATPGVYAELATGIISGNSIRGHGVSTSALSGAIQLYYTSGTVVANNRIVESSPHGVVLYHTNYNFLLSGNTVVDPFSSTLSLAAAVNVSSTYNTGKINNNTLIRGAKTATNVATYGVNVGNSTTNTITWESNDFSIAATSVINDPGSRLTYGLNLSGTLSARPSASSGLFGATYLATDELGGTQYRCNKVGGSYIWQQTGAGVNAGVTDGLWRPRDSDLLGTSGDPAVYCTVNQTAMVSGTQYVTRVKMDQSGPITKGVFFLGIVGTSITEGSIDIYDSTGARIGTGDISTTLAGTSGLKQITLASPTSSLIAGDVVYVGLRTTFAGTAPQIRGLATSSVPSSITPSGAKIRYGTQGTGISSSQTSITVASIASVAVGAQCHWVALI